MPSAGPLLRNEVYTRFLLKRTAAGFLFNDFTLKKVHVPKATFEDIAENHPAGIVYVICGAFGDRITQSRSNAVLAEYQVRVGYQRVVDDPYDEDPTILDTLIDFVEELDYVCRKEIQPNTDFAYVRTEFEKDENGIPYSYMRLETIATFESYFTAYFNLAVP